MVCVCRYEVLRVDKHIPMSCFAMRCFVSTNTYLVRRIDTHVATRCILCASHFDSCIVSSVDTHIAMHRVASQCRHTRIHCDAPGTTLRLSSVDTHIAMHRVCRRNVFLYVDTNTQECAKRKAVEMGSSPSAPPKPGSVAVPTMLSERTRDSIVGSATRRVRCNPSCPVLGLIPNRPLIPNRGVIHHAPY